MIAILVGFLSLFFYIKYWWFSDFRKKLDKIPGPPGLPFVGNALEVARHIDDPMQLFQGKWVQEYGEIYKNQNFNNFCVHVSSPEYIEEVLKSQTLITKGKHYRLLKDWLGDGLLTTTGEKWRWRRRLLTPAFHFQILETFYDIFNEQSQILVEQLEKARNLNASNEVDVYRLITNCALDIICETAMGVSVHAQTTDSEYAKAVYRIASLVNKRLLKPWLFIEFLFQNAELGRQHNECLKIVHDFTKQVIQERKETLKWRNENLEINNQISKKKKAFLDLLLESAQQTSTLTDQDIKEEVDTFMFAGHDTNSAAMTWFLYLIAKNPAEQERLYQELYEVFKNTDRFCTKDDIPHLKYLECCIKETLRLCPSVPAINRTVTEDFKIGGYDIPVGCSVSVLIQTVHRNPKYFTDPESYKPERFLPENSKERHPFAFVPFSAGPRNCLGQKFAMLEEKFILSALLRKFRFELSPNTEAKPEVGLVLKPKDHLILRVLPRSQ